MQTIKLIDKLDNIPVFGVDDVCRITGKDRKYAKLKLSRMHEKKLVKRIMRDKYTRKRNPFVIASHLYNPSYISFWSASQFYGYTDQLPITIKVVTDKARESIDFDNIRFDFIKAKNIYGFRTIRIAEGRIYIADPEKLLIDAVSRPDLMGNEEEILNVYESVIPNTKKLIKYLKHQSVLSVTKRVGSLIELTQRIDMSRSFTLDSNYTKGITGLPISDDLSRKWRIKRDQ